MLNPGMDTDVFTAFIDQLKRYVRERLIPAEADVIANDRIPDEILDEMPESLRLDAIVACGADQLFEFPLIDCGYPMWIENARVA